MDYEKIIIWSDEGKNDLNQLINYLDVHWSKSVAEKFIEILEITIRRIKLNPTQFQIVTGKASIYKVIVTKHNTIYFELFDGRIEILRIFDTRQNPDKLTFTT